MKLLLALIVGLFIGYYAHELRDKKEVEPPAEPPKLPGEVSFQESLQLQSDYVAHSPDSSIVYLNLSRENLEFIQAVNAHFKFPEGINLYLARQDGENDKVLIVPYGIEVNEDPTDDGEGEEKAVFILDQRNPICPPVCDANSPYKSR